MKLMRKAEQAFRTKNCLKQLSWTLFEDSWAAADENSVRRLDCVVCQTTSDCIGVVRKDFVNIELDRCIAFDRLTETVHTGTVHTGADRKIVENTVAVGMTAARMTVEYRANYMLARKAKEFVNYTRILARGCRLL